MAGTPAFTCCTAWLPVSAPSEFTYGRSCIRRHSFSAPRFASVCSIGTLPRNRMTSAAL